MVKKRQRQEILMSWIWWLIKWKSSVQDLSQVSGDWMLCRYPNYLIFESLDVKGDLFPIEGSVQAQFTPSMLWTLLNLVILGYYITLFSHFLEISFSSSQFPVSGISRRKFWMTMYVVYEDLVYWPQEQFNIYIWSCMSASLTIIVWIHSSDRQSLIPFRGSSMLKLFAWY